jgi:signal transduction histidine kinase
MGNTVPLPVAVSSTPAATAPSRWVVLVVASGGAVAAGGLILLAYASVALQQPGLDALTACWLTIPYIVAGLIAWRLRPDSRLGVLMVTAGFATVANFLVWANNDLLFTIGVACQFLPPVLFLHVFLAFPSGLIESRPERILVAASYGTAALTLPALVLGQAAPRNVFALTDQSALAEALQKTQLVLVSVLSLAGIAFLVRRRRRNGRPLRAALSYLVDSFAIALLMIAVLLMAGFFGWSAVQQPIRLATFGVVGLAPIVFLAALLLARLGRASVADLLIDLGVNPGPIELQEAVARALRDPSVQLAYWLPDFDSYADVDGRQIHLEDGSGRSATPIVTDGVPVAMMLHDSGLDDEPRLIASVAAATGMSIQNAQLQVELRARLEELRGSRIRILEAEQRERRRLERDLHDGAQQRLIALSMELGELGDQLPGDSDLGTRIDRARQEVTASLAELRDLAHGIHPAAVSDHGLAVALESVATRATIPVEVIGATEDRFPEPVELAAFFIVCEALANIARHSEASSALVELERKQAALVVEVTDDGIGGASADTGTGLRGVADRVEALGGRLQVWSPVGEGTRLRAEIPCG